MQHSEQIQIRASFSSAILMQGCFRQSHCRCFKSPTTAGSCLLRTTMFHKIHTQYIQKGGYLLLGWNPIREERALIEGSSFAFKYQVGVTVFTGCQKSVFLWRSPNLNYIKRLLLSSIITSVLLLKVPHSQLKIQLSIIFIFSYLIYQYKKYRIKINPILHLQQRRSS